MVEQARNIQDVELPEPGALIAYAPPKKSATPVDASDRAEITARTILGLLNQAAQIADENTKHALDVAHKLSRQLRLAEDRILALETDLKQYRDRAERAEKWLNHISVEIEQRFFRSSDHIRN
jgi:hypothetical protein